MCSAQGGTIYADGIGRMIFWGANEPAAADYPAPGSLWMDTSNAILKYNAGTISSPSWTSTASAAAQSLDGAYNNDSGERTVTVDGGSIVFDCSDSSNDYALVINNTSTSGALAAGLTIDSEGNGSTITAGLLFKTTGTSAAITTAIDASDSGITTSLSIGATAIAGTYFTVSNVGLVGCVGLGYGAGTLSGTGDIAINTTAFTVTGATGATLISSTLHVTGACTFDSTVSGTFTGTWASTTWSAATVTITPAATTGDGVTITGDTVTTGNILKIHADASLSTGYFINCMDVSAAKFTVAEDGSVTIAGTGAGTDALTLTLGDIVLVNGHIDLTNGDFTMAEGKITATTTTDEASKISRNKTGATTAMFEFETTHTGDTGVTLTIDNDCTGDGKALEITYAGTSDAVTISGACAADAVVQVTATHATAAVLELISAASATQSIALFAPTQAAAATGWLGGNNTGMIHIASAGNLGSATASMLYIAYSGTGTATGLGTSIRVVDTGATADSTAVYVSSNAGIALGVVGVSTPDTIVVTSAAAAASALKMTMSATNGTALEVINSAASAVSAINATCTSGTWVGAAGVGMIQATSSGNLANATASLLLLTYSGTGAATGLGTCIQVADTGATNTSAAVYIASSTGIAFKVAHTGAVDGCVISSAANTASAVQVTTTHTAGTALELICAASTAVAMALIDGTTNNWIGAATTGMLTLQCDGALAQATTSLLYVNFDGTVAVANGMGTCIKVDDDGGTSSAWAVEINAATGEALYVTLGKSHFVESLSCLASPVFKAGPNFIVAGGGNNALTATLVDSVGANIALTDGLLILVDTATFTLQAGANTLTLNGGDAKSIKLASNPATDIGAHAASSMIHLAYNATSDVWQLLGA